MATAIPFTRHLARAALPHVQQHGFTAEALLQAAAAAAPLPGIDAGTPSLPAHPPLTRQALHALYPSPPARETDPRQFSLKGLVIGNGGRTSLSKRELVALARGQGTARRGRERTGPARALVQEWLVQGRHDMVDRVRQSRLQGEAAYAKGIEARLRYNHDVLDKLPQVSAARSSRGASAGRR